MAIVLRRLVPLVLLALFWAPAAYAWSWPVQGPVLQEFSFDSTHPYAAGQHRGIDAGASAGSTVHAPAGGTITFAGTVPTSGTSLTILTSDGYSVTLTHLGTLAVSRGATVAEGEPVGTVGPSGTPELDVPYVHLGIRVASDPNGYLDPLTVLPALAPSTPPVPPATSAAPVPSAASAPAATPAPLPQTTPAPASTVPEAPATAAVPGSATPAATEPATSATSGAAPASPPVAQVKTATPASPRRPETRRAPQSRPMPTHMHVRVRARAASAHARSSSHAGRTPQPVAETPVLFRHRPVPGAASARERPAITETRFPVWPFALGAGATVLTVLSVLAGLRRLRRPPASPPELGAIVIPLPRRPEPLEERRVA